MGEVEQVGTLGLVKLQRMRKRVQHAVGHAIQVAAFETGVVIDADSGEQRDFLPAEPRHAPVTAVGRQACPFWRNPGPPGDQKLANLVAAVHKPRRYLRRNRYGRACHYQDQEGPCSASGLTRFQTYLTCKDGARTRY
jgi:hypothetical protein